MHEIYLRKEVVTYNFQTPLEDNKVATNSFYSQETSTLYWKQKQSATQLVMVCGSSHKERENGEHQWVMVVIVEQMKKYFVALV